MLRGLLGSEMCIRDRCVCVCVCVCVAGPCNAWMAIFDIGNMVDALVFCQVERF